MTNQGPWLPMTSNDLLSLMNLRLLDSDELLPWEVVPLARSYHVRKPQFGYLITNTRGSPKCSRGLSKARYTCKGLNSPLFLLFNSFSIKTHKITNFEATLHADGYTFSFNVIWNQSQLLMICGSHNQHFIPRSAHKHLGWKTYVSLSSNTQGNVQPLEIHRSTPTFAQPLGVTI